MPENVVREQLEALNIRVQAVTQLRSGQHIPSTYMHAAMEGGAMPENQSRSVRKYR
jgi:hypothetical protein